MPDSSQIKKIKDILRKADTTLRAAETLFKNEFYGDAVSRAYYSAFYAVEALLLYHVKNYSSHKAVHASFHRDIINKGLLPRDTGKIFSDLFTHRQIGDYRIWPQISLEQAELDVQNAKTIIHEVKHWFSINVEEFKNINSNS